MLHHVFRYKFADISEEHIASIFRVKEEAKEVAVKKQAATKHYLFLHQYMKLTNTTSDNIGSQESLHEKN
jgi:hypothetical protein